MIKKFCFKLTTLLLVMHGTVLGMHATKTLRMVSSSRLSRNIRVSSQDSFNQFLVDGVQSKENITDSFAAIARTLNNIDKKLEEQNKLLQANLEVKTIEVECKIRNSYYMNSDERKEMRQRCGRISGINIKDE